ncbi:MAG: HesA/MoeB/ThiF family protein [Polyangiales bacterium]
MTPPRLREVDVVVVGLGGLGCPDAWALRHGARSLRLIDEDRVERSNLHRQILFRDADLGRHKVEAAAEALAPFARVEVVAAHLAPENAATLLGGARVIVEGTDNLPAKFLTSDTAWALQIPVVHGACAGWVGTVLPVIPGVGACYRCLFEEPPDDEAGSCVTAGVFGPVTSLTGALMAADALRILRGDTSHAGAVARYDGRTQRFRSTPFASRSGCRCATQPLAPQGDPSP